MITKNLTSSNQPLRSGDIYEIVDENKNSTRHIYYAPVIEEVTVPTILTITSVEIDSELQELIDLPDGSQKLMLLTDDTTPITADFVVTVIRNGATVTDINERFVLEIVATGNSAPINKPILFIDGIASFSIDWTLQGTWYLTEKSVNADLPEKDHFQFSGLKFVVYKL